jgi:phospholipid/cholesterol/gamma-HCH transport system permease protein
MALATAPVVTPRPVAVHLLGAKVVGGVHHAAGSTALLLHAVARLAALRRPPVRTVLLRQVYFSGIEALETVAIVSAVMGVVIVSQVVGLAGASSLTGKVLVWTVVREIAPLLVAILMVARSVPAVATELASMTLHREVDTLWAAGIDPIAYLILPRILGMTLSVVALTLYCQVVAIAGGLALAALAVDLPPLHQLWAVGQELHPCDLGISLIKGLLFGLGIATAACHHGYRPHTSATQIPQAATGAVMHALLFLFLTDGVVTFLTLP